MTRRLLQRFSILLLFYHNDKATAQNHSSITNDRRIIFVHFHKSGGTSACMAFRRAKYIKGLCKGSSCNCNSLYRSLRVGDATAVSAKMKAANQQICAIETGLAWPLKSSLFVSLASKLTFATILRKPWDRFRSSYERVLSIENDAKKVSSKKKKKTRVFYTDITLAEFASIKGDNIPNVRTYGCFNQANFYVRFLIGAACSSPQKDYQNETKKHHLSFSRIDGADLENSRTILSSFDFVSTLEDEELPAKFNHFIGQSASNGWMSQSHYSNNINSRWYSYGKGVPLDEKRQEEEAKYEGVFNRSNLFDLRLYKWVEAGLPEVRIKGQQIPGLSTTKE